MARKDLYIQKRGETAIGLEGFVIVLDQYVLLLSLDYAEPSCHFLIGSTLMPSIYLSISQVARGVTNRKKRDIKTTFRAC